MIVPGRFAHLRPATAADDAFLYEVFTSLWTEEVSLMPNPQLVQHFLRIQYTAQQQRFDARHPHMQRFVVMCEGEPAGRLFLDRTPSLVHVVELTLLPRFRARGLCSTLIRDVVAEAHQNGQTVSIRADRRSATGAAICERLGFRMVVVDDQDRYFEWSPADRLEAEVPADRAAPGAGRIGA